jgi:hypothetical protein
MFVDEEPTPVAAAAQSKTRKTHADAGDFQFAILRRLA